MSTERKRGFIRKIPLIAYVVVAGMIGVLSHPAELSLELALLVGDGLPPSFVAFDKAIFFMPVLYSLCFGAAVAICIEIGVFLTSGLSKCIVSRGGRVPLDDMTIEALELQFFYDGKLSRAKMRRIAIAMGVYMCIAFCFDLMMLVVFKGYF